MCWRSLNGFIRRDETGVGVPCFASDGALRAACLEEQNVTHLVPRMSKSQLSGLRTLASKHNADR